MRLLLCLSLLALVPAGQGVAQDHPREERGEHRGPRRLFISPMGEPFRATGDGDMPERQWFDGADADHDGRLTRAEFAADADRFFAFLDVDHDGEIGPEEIERYETRIAPEIRTGGGGGGGPRGEGRARGGGMRHGGGGHGGGGRRRMADNGGERGGGADRAGEPRRIGAGRFSYLDLPEPVVAADANMNRGISRDEFRQAADQRFQALDRNHDGVLVADELHR